MLVNTSDSNRDVFNQIFTNCINNKMNPSDFEDVCRGIGGVTAFEDKWKAWVMEQRIPAAGSVEEGVFHSDFANFSVTQPDETWVFDGDSSSVPPADVTWFQIAIKKEKGLIAVLAGNNKERLSADAVVSRKKEQLDKTHEVISSDRLNANGYEAYEIVYKEKPPEKKEEPKKPKVPFRAPYVGQEGDEGNKEREEKKPEPLKKFRRVYVTTVPHVIMLELSAPVDEFDKYRADFEKTVQSILLTLR